MKKVIIITLILGLVIWGGQQLAFARTSSSHSFKVCLHLPPAVEIKSNFGDNTALEENAEKLINETITEEIVRNNETILLKTIVVK